MPRASIFNKRGAVSFYLKIPLMTRFEEVFDSANYRRPPQEWYVVVTDVISSTKAIEAGKYKDVNVSGALAAMAITNYIGTMDFPFLFGGDGMTYIIPDTIVKRVRSILADVRRIARDILNMELRVGLVPLSRVYNDGHELQIARLRVSERYIQAILDGSGVDYAEKLVKDPQTTDEFQVPLDYPIERATDLSGFNCRWKPVESPFGETIALIVKARGSSYHAMNDTNKIVYSKIQEIFGEAKNYRPIRPKNMNIGTTADQLRTHASITSRHTRGIIYQLHLLQVRVANIMAKYVARSRLASSKDTSFINSDFRKFDGTLKMIISCTTENRIRFQNFLEDLYQKGRIFYGVHVSDKALLTCLVQQARGEVHFVDSDNGGYALAAKHLKKQVAALKVTQPS